MGQMCHRRLAKYFYTPKDDANNSSNFPDYSALEIVNLPLAFQWRLCPRQEQLGQHTTTTSRFIAPFRL